METDGLNAVKNRYIEQISLKRAEIMELEKKLNLLEEIENEMGVNVTQRPINLTGSSNYSKMGLTEAAFDSLRMLTMKAVPDITKSKIAKCMVDGGFKPEGKNFLISVDTALRRLAKNPQNKITSALKEGKRIYVLKDGTGMI